MKKLVDGSASTDSAEGPTAEGIRRHRSAGSAWRSAWCCAIALLVTLMSANPALAGRLETLDDLFYRVAANAEGFAGAYYTEDGALAIAVKPKDKTLTSSEKKRALDALVSVFGKNVLRPVPSMKRPQAGIGSVVYRRADFKFRDLHGWYQDVRGVLRERGVGYTDIDERSNRLVVGVAGGKPSSAVVNYLAKLNIPFSSILFEESEKLYFYYEGSISGSEQRPALGGIEIGLQQGGRCTIGVNAWFPKWWWQEPGFITAGHCGSYGDWSADWFTQPVGPDIIAAEHLNPGFWWGSECPTAGCRYSDTAAVIYDGDVEFADPATIIRTRGFDADLNIDEDNQTIDVTGESPWLLGGDNVHKIGVGRGWTIGAIGDTCVDTPSPADETLTFLCQYEVNSLDGSNIACRGDSGAPVFFWHETIAPTAAMAGFLFAGRGQQCASTYMFSPMSGVRQDLGQFEIPH